MTKRPQSRGGKGSHSGPRAQKLPDEGESDYDKAYLKNYLRDGKWNWHSINAVF